MTFGVEVMVNVPTENAELERIEVVEVLGNGKGNVEVGLDDHLCYHYVSYFVICPFTRITYRSKWR